MTFESILPVRCPDCNTLVSSKEDACPNCGAQLKKSVFEQEAQLYKTEVLRRTENNSSWIKIPFVILTMILLMSVSSVYDEYAENGKDLYEVLIIISCLTAFYSGLTVLSFYKPMPAAITGLLIFFILAGLCIIGIMSDSGSAAEEKKDTIIIYILVFLLFFPAALIKGIYNLSQDKK